MNKKNLFLYISWLGIVLISLIFNAHNTNKNLELRSIQAARSFFQGIISTRLWNASTKGIYAPTNDYITPNPYLKSPMRDLETVNGIHLTMINPAYMTRMISEIAEKKNGVKFHITSLLPIRPANTPLAWEKKWLETFERGESEQYEFIKDSSGKKLRYMAPLYVEKKCLKCHAQQGYKEGDVRGGISVTLPPYNDHTNRLLIFSHGVIAVLGLLSLFIFNLIVNRNLKEIKEKEEKYRQMFMENTAIKFLVDPADGAIIDANKAAALFYGYELKELLKLKIYDINSLPPEQALEETNGNKSKQQLQHYISQHKLSSGEIREVEVYSGPITVQGKTLLFSIIHDISDKKKAETEIKEQNTFLHNILESIPDPFYVIDTSNYKLVIANSATSPKGDWEGKTCYNLTHKRNTPCEGQKHRCTLKEVIRTKKPVCLEHNHYDRAGNKSIVEVTGYPVFDEDGNVTNLIEYSKDITNLRLAEEEKEKLKGQLAQAYKMEAIGTLAGGIAHDFNNILGTIIGYTDMAKDDVEQGSQIEQDLEKVLIAANRAKDLVQQILAFSRQAQVELFPLKLQPLVKECLKLLRASIPTTINITEHIDLVTGSVLADPTQIHQILMNLCTNAYHAMENTGGVLDVSLQTTFIKSHEQEKVLHLTPGEYVEITVSDNGSGIRPDIIDKIFDPYFTTKEVGQGTGMGLAIIHGIVQEYGGTITVESRLGKGSTFHVFFPVVKEDNLPDTTEQGGTPGGKERVLLIDDEELLADMGKDMLERLGYSVTVRYSSFEALDTFQNTPDKFDLVITDQTMPGMTGADLARRILQIQPEIPIILCTGYSNLINEETAKGLGIKGFTLKPITKEVIARLIRKVLNKTV